MSGESMAVTAEAAVQHYYSDTYISRLSVEKAWDQECCRGARRRRLFPYRVLLT